IRMWNFINNWNLSKFDTCQREDGNDDPWGSGEWEFYVAETKEPEKDLTNKFSTFLIYKTLKTIRKRRQMDPFSYKQCKCEFWRSFL
ncbi:hypothetical protein HID58_088361, partial [Brassica napus]